MSDPQTSAAPTPKVDAALDAFAEDNLTNPDGWEVARQLERGHAELLTALQGMFALIESATLVRDTSRDADPKWYLTALNITRTLTEAKAAIERAKGAA